VTTWGALDAVFSPLEGLPGFVHYTVEDGLGVFRREQLLTYFAGRHRKHERMRLVSVDMERTNLPGGVAIGFLLERRADDRRVDLFREKGEIDCVRGQISVWSMGGSRLAQEGMSTPCSITRDG